MRNSEIVITATAEETYLTLDQFAVLCAVEPDWILQHVEEGLLSAVEMETGNWQFSSEELTRAKRIIEIERIFDALPELAALVADMQEELDDLRSQLRWLTSK
ncbi:MAG: chaperone modulator CbpM [Gammaproteobacteria bacterium]